MQVQYLTSLVLKFIQILTAPETQKDLIFLIKEIILTFN